MDTIPVDIVGKAPSGAPPESLLLALSWLPSMITQDEAPLSPGRELENKMKKEQAEGINACF